MIVTKVMTAGGIIVKTMLANVRASGAEHLRSVIMRGESGRERCKRLFGINGMFIISIAGVPNECSDSCDRVRD